LPLDFESLLHRAMHIRIVALRVSRFRSIQRSHTIVLLCHIVEVEAHLDRGFYGALGMTVDAVDLGNTGYGVEVAYFRTGVRQLTSATCQAM
jgi:hypothetical protein